MIVIDNPVIVELEREGRDDTVVNDVIVEGFGHKQVKLKKCVRYEIFVGKMDYVYKWSNESNKKDDLNEARKV